MARLTQLAYAVWPGRPYRAGAFAGRLPEPAPTGGALRPRWLRRGRR